ncbi:MAG: MBL fold metallo-hydrolase [Pseudomonadota bacterium]
MHLRITWILSLLVVTTSGAHELPTTAQYLGNEGILFSHGGESVLFDAFFEESYGQYVLLDRSTNQAIKFAKEPYDNVKLVFVSHVHGDHFSAAPTVDYLQEQTSVRLFGSGQVVDAILALDDSLQARLHRVDLSPGEVPVDYSIDPFKVTVVAIPHAGGERTKDIQNLAFKVSIDDSRTMVHMGDAGPDLSVFNPLRGFFEGVHVAFPPYWFYLNEVGRDILENVITADITIGVHVPAKYIGQGDVLREEVGGDVFTDPGETRSFKPN